MLGGINFGDKKINSKRHAKKLARKVQKTVLPGEFPFGSRKKIIVRDKTGKVFHVKNSSAHIALQKAKNK